MENMVSRSFYGMACLIAGFRTIVAVEPGMHGLVIWAHVAAGIGFFVGSGVVIARGCR